MLCARCKANGQGRCASPGKETDAVSLGINAGYRCAGRTENAVALDNQTGEDGGFAWLCSHYPVYWAELPILASWLRLAPQSLMLLNITVAPVAPAILTPAGSLIGKVADRKSTRLNSSHLVISYAVFCL